VRVEVRRTGDVLAGPLREPGARIGLLKVDVEGAELEVLRGIDAEQWPRIDQVVMELESFAIAASLVGVISQRLVRRLCPACATEGPLSPALLDQLALVEVLPRDWKGNVKRPKGCEVCGGTGYRGRVGVFEILVADDALREAIARGATNLELKEIAKRGAFVPMSRYSSYLLTNGVTSAEELITIHAGAGHA
jgi:type II secretory ATPase GspE/PulE/Tfp pilus assembly ATPase PilB-like protein